MLKVSAHVLAEPLTKLFNDILLSPTLFNLCINDIPELLNNDCDPVRLDNWSVSTLKYADDLVLISSSQEGLQSCLNNLSDYCKKWKLKINTLKAKVMVFSKCGKISNCIFKFNNNTLECVKNYKYLGIEFSSFASFTLAKVSLFKKKLIFGKPFVTQIFIKL